MSASRKARALSWVLPLLAALSGFLPAQEGFVDCFDDGEVFDGEPVAWSLTGPNNCGPTCRSESNFDAGGGDLHIKPCGLDLANAVWLISEEDREGDVSVRFQARLDGEGELGAFVHAGSCVSFYGGMLSTSPVNGVGISLSRSDGGLPLPLFETERAEILQGQDYVLQLDIRGDDLQLRVWPAEEGPMGLPLAEIAATDATYRQGRVMIGYIAREAGADAVVRYIQVSDNTITGDAPCTSAGEIGEWPVPAPALENGDLDGDWTINLSDVLRLLNHLFAGDAAPMPILCGTAVSNGDANGDGRVNLIDAIYLLEHLFAGGSSPVPLCGNEPPGIAEIATQILGEPTDVRRDLRRALDATVRLRTPDEARNGGYVTHFSVSCVEGLGVPLIDEQAYGSSPDSSRPAICYYAPDENGDVRIAALEWVVYEDTVPTSPVLFGRPMEGPTGDLLVPFGIRSAYYRQVHLYRHNPSGLFAAFNPETQGICDCGQTFCPR